MIKNLPQFVKEMQDLAAKLPPAEMRKLATYLALEGLKRVVLRTPVDSGLARGNWQVGIGKRGTGVLSRKDRAGTATIASGTSKILSAPDFPFISIYNNLPYIAVLEFGGFDPANPGPSKDKRPDRFGRILVRDGYSAYAPRGMVAITVEELRKALPNDTR
jgi:hypothetical protein